MTPLQRDRRLIKKARLLLVLNGNNHEVAFDKVCEEVCKYGKTAGLTFGGQKTRTSLHIHSGYCPHHEKRLIFKSDYTYCIEWLDPENKPENYGK